MAHVLFLKLKMSDTFKLFESTDPSNQSCDITRDDRPDLAQKNSNACAGVRESTEND